MKTKYELKLLLIILPFFVFICCKTKLSYKDRFEGFQRGILRVNIRIDYKESTDEVPYDNGFHNILLESGKKRANRLLESYVKNIKVNDKKIMNAINSIPNVIKTARIIQQDCNDDYCEAFIDFDILEWEKELNIKKD